MSRARNQVHEMGTHRTNGLVSLIQIKYKKNSRETCGLGKTLGHGREVGEGEMEMSLASSVDKDRS